MLSYFGLKTEWPEAHIQAARGLNRETPSHAASDRLTHAVGSMPVFPVEWSRII
ncbi:hypothetical protein [Ferranicluibacter rubi]|uniref:Uncharacterized protein n=1 Tax=Ferranicluibacter rubi TaxID=2715133 RepID=A0AA43ZHF9_9HYPH|nr:hypothetical protein [Ferranicluibacter rubi]NHT77968.1 hypothetical protein [Ferranicluibacter rubi]